MKNNKTESDGRAGNKKPNKGSMTSHQKANRAKSKVHLFLQNSPFS